MREKGRWADWGAIAAGLALGVSFIWHGMLGFGGGAMFVLGLCAIVAAVLSLTRPGAMSGEIAVLGVGVLAFTLPWTLGYTDVTAAAWTAWTTGGIIALLGAYGLVKANQARKEDPDLAWTTHRNELPD